MNKKLNILLLDQGRQALPFLKSFSRAGHKTSIVCNTRFSEGYFSRYPSKRLLWPSHMKEGPAFEKKLLTYLKENNVDVVISVGDASSEILSKNKEEIIKHTRITSPDYFTFLQASDKLRLMQYCMENDLPCPKTYALTDETIGRLHELLEFPVMVKPVRGVGAIGVERYDNQEGLVAAYPALREKYGELIIQEFIAPDGSMQYQAEAFVDEKGEMKVCMVILKPRFFPVKGGTSTANLTIDHPEITETTRRLLEGLEWKGAADVDYILDPRDNTARILEINPRVTAGIKIGFVAGIDYADLHLKLAFGEPIPTISNYTLGVYCRNFFLEMLWYILSDKKMKKETTPPFFTIFRKNMVDQVFSISDPLAGIGFFLSMVRRYTNIRNFKAKFHR
jgi:predicted ATP-grasp superfamily ATP-dependent carboligase